MATFQERFNQLRDEYGGSDSQLAKVLGCSKQAVSTWASGKSVPKALTIIGIASHFNVSPAWLAGRENERR